MRFVGIWYVVTIACGFVAALAVFSWRIDVLYKSSGGKPSEKKTAFVIAAMAITMFVSIGAMYLLIKTGVYKGDSYYSLLLTFLLGVAFGTLARWLGFQFRNLAPANKDKK